MARYVTTVLFVPSHRDGTVQLNLKSENII